VKLLHLRGAGRIQRERLFGWRQRVVMRDDERILAQYHRDGGRSTAGPFLLVSDGHLGNLLRHHRFRFVHG
jgi:hypothetical protein